MIRTIGIIFTFLFFSIQGFAQSDIEDFIKEGIQYHDAGNYEKAIEVYKKALKINPKSALANYEIALSYFSNGEYKKAIKYSDIVLKQNDEFLLQCYMTKGSALDMLGKTKESIKLFEKAIKKTKGHYLLYYNLALNYFKINDLDKAEKNAFKAIEYNPNHSSSHLMLANIHNQKGNSVQTLLATHFFLFLEPNTKRSSDAYIMLKENFSGNVSKDPSKPNTTNIKLSLGDPSPFQTTELMIAMLEASKSIEENEEKTDDEMFVENTQTFFKFLGDLNEKEEEGIWWALYSPFFYDIAKSEHMQTYCKYITQSSNENSQKWLSENEDKVNEFGEWLNKE